MKQLQWMLGLFVLCLIWTTACTAPSDEGCPQNLYISDSGSDDNPCLLTKPCKTIKSALQKGHELCPNGFGVFFKISETQDYRMMISRPLPSGKLLLNWLKVVMYFLTPVIGGFFIGWIVSMQFRRRSSGGVK